MTKVLADELRDELFRDLDDCKETAGLIKMLIEKGGQSPYAIALIFSLFTRAALTEITTILSLPNEEQKLIYIHDNLRSFLDRHNVISEDLDHELEQIEHRNEAKEH